MNKQGYVLLLVLLGAVLFFGKVTATEAAVTADCFTEHQEAYFGSPADEDFNFTCASAQTVYFGICDNYIIPERSYTITFKGDIVARNTFSGASQSVFIGSGMSDAGDNMMTVNIVDVPGYDVVYLYAVSSDYQEVVDVLSPCLDSSDDGSGEAPNVQNGGCYGSMPVFTADTAPSAGTLELHVLLGNEGARSDEQIMETWHIGEGDQINNAMVHDLKGRRYARLWWQPDDSDEWYLLPSQYYHEGNSTADEYGIACNSSQPSYHTSFADAIAESNVCFDLINGCR